MSTPLEVIEKGKKRYEMYYCLHTVMPKDSQAEVREFIKAQTLALLQALHDELEGKKKTKNGVKHFGGNGYFNQQGYNQAITDQQDSLQALMDKIRV